MPDRKPRPFPVTIEVEFLDRLSEPVRDGKAKSVSAIIRTALEEYDFSNVVVVHPSQLQISVRLSGELRKTLRKVSRSKHTSVGQLVRAAVEAYLPKLELLPPVAVEKGPVKRKARANTKKRVTKSKKASSTARKKTATKRK